MSPDAWPPGWLAAGPEDAGPGQPSRLGREHLGSGRDGWAEGWDRWRRCPQEPAGDGSPGRVGWRSVGVTEGGEGEGGEGEGPWKKAHRRKESAIQVLLRAGYAARRRWARERVGQRQVGTHLLDDWRYLSGPAAGLQAVDPWETGARMRDCGARWGMQLRYRPADGALLTLPLPAMCGQRHVCPVCAAQRSRALSAALRSAVQREPEDRRQIFLTLTQRAQVGEVLADAIARIRSSWDRMTKGRPGTDWRERVPGWWWGMEATRGSKGQHWHVHLHILLTVGAAAVDALPQWVASRWAAATDAEAQGRGWDAAAACQRRSPIPVDGWRRRESGDRIEWVEPLGLVQARIYRGDLSGPWWHVLPPDDLRAVGQVAKYSTPIGALGPVHLAEFLAAAHGRRWHGGGGCWRSVVRDADADDAAGLDLGTGVSVAGPAAPSLDLVAPDLGRPGGGWGTPLVSSVTWRLCGQGAEEAAAQAEAMGAISEWRDVRERTVRRVLGELREVDVLRRALFLDVPVDQVIGSLGRTLDELRISRDGDRKGRGDRAGPAPPGPNGGDQLRE